MLSIAVFLSSPHHDLHVPDLAREGHIRGHFGGVLRTVLREFPAELFGSPALRAHCVRLSFRAAAFLSLGKV